MLKHVSFVSYSCNVTYAEETLRSRGNALAKTYAEDVCFTAHVSVYRCVQTPSIWHRPYFIRSLTAMCLQKELGTKANVCTLCNLIAQLLLLRLCVCFCYYTAAVVKLLLMLLAVLLFLC